jgi:hypothetical protein
LRPGADFDVTACVFGSAEDLLTIFFEAVGVAGDESDARKFFSKERCCCRTDLRAGADDYEKWLFFLSHCLKFGISDRLDYRN